MMGETLFVLLAVLAVTFRGIRTEDLSLGTCYCSYTDGRSAVSFPDCGGSRVCNIIRQEPSNRNSARTAFGCLMQHITSTDGKRVDFLQSCVEDDFAYLSACNEEGNRPNFKNYTIYVTREDPLRFTICCYTSMCNTEEVYRKVLADIVTPTTMPNQSSPPPLYAVILIPILSVMALVIICIIILMLCCHFHILSMNPHSSIETPTITSGDSSSYGEQSLNELLEYSGSGAGLPLLVQRSIAGQIGLHELIGKGRYGEVWKGSYKCDEVAVKIFHTREEASWTHEVDIYQTCLFRHPNILRFIASDNKDVGVQVELWLITEFCEFGSLYDLLTQRTLEPSVMLHLAYTSSCGLDHLHMEIFGHEAKPAIVHRDLKSRNILVKADYTCCIGDLGLALRYNRASDQVEDPPSKRVGTKRYLAPEIIDESISFKHFESFKRADIYSFGLILWEITTRGEIDGVAEDYQMPYQGLVPTDPSFEDMKKTVVIDQRRPTISNRWTQSELFCGMSKLIQQCWLHDSDARLTSLRLKKSLHNLQQTCIVENKKDKEH